VEPEGGGGLHLTDGSEGRSTHAVHIYIHGGGGRAEKAADPPRPRDERAVANEMSAVKGRGGDPSRETPTRLDPPRLQDLYFVFYYF